MRAELAKRRLDGFIVPRADRFQNEYVPPSDERLAWLTGFTGSAGAAIVLADRAVIFVDGRYQVQVREEVDSGVFTIEHLVERPPTLWIETNLKAGAKLGYSPWLHTVDGAERLAKACAAAEAALVPVEDNPIDAIWTDRPQPPLGAVVATICVSPAKAPRTSSRGCAPRCESFPPTRWWCPIRKRCRGCSISAAAMCRTRRWCWLSPQCRKRAGRRSMSICASSATRCAAIWKRSPKCGRTPRFERDLAEFGKERKTVRLDPSGCAEEIARLVVENGGSIARGSDPIAPMKAVKNATEIAGARAAQQRDGVAMTRFLAWFDREAPRGGLTEIDAVEALESFRRDTGQLKDVSFPSISGAGPNGAIVHYRVTRRSNRRIAPGELFLIDSGGQYEDGTTDITRTVAVGTPTPDMRKNFTLVLKGHIAMARAVFPDGTNGAQLDTLARQYLWQAGLDFDHGTGHGVGSYLSVHEGPARISKLGAYPLKRGMILSNEPGYYRTGAYGIRIENLVLVTEAPPVADAEKPLNAFETLTVAPIDTRLIDQTLLTDDEASWVNSYHSHVRDLVAPALDLETRAWLFGATALLPIRIKK